MTTWKDAARMPVIVTAICLVVLLMRATALLVARLDNLGKGASGAAVQNLKLMLGL